MKSILTSLFTFVALTSIHAQSSWSIQRNLTWSEKPLTHSLNPNRVREAAHFQGAVYSIKNAPNLPVFTYRFPLTTDGRLSAEVLNVTYAPLSIKTDADYEKLGDALEATATVTQQRSNYFGNVSFVPIRRNGSTLEKVISFELKINFIPENRAVLRGPTSTKVSVLSSGDVYKIAIKETGVYKLDYNFLKNELKINNIDALDPKTIKIYGNGGGMLPERNDATRADDLTENAIVVSGEDDGKFNSGDFILFYGVGPDKWIFDRNLREFNRPKNIYDDEAYYFIKISSGNGLRVANQSTLPNAAYTTTSFDDFARFEEDKINLLASNPCNCTQGSGKLWFGDAFAEGLREKSFGDKFGFKNVITTEKGKVWVRFASASYDFTNVSLTIANQNFSSGIGSADPNNVDGVYARLGEIKQIFTPNGDNLDVKVKHEASGTTRGWLDFIQIALRRQLRLEGAQMGFRDVKTLDYASAAYQLANVTGNTLVWDVTNPLKPANQQFTLTGNQLTFAVNTEGLMRQFVAFDRTNALLKASAEGKVDNQNLHAIDNVDLVVVYPKEFESAARKLADHRRNFSKFNVELAEINQIYNEFSSGALDPAAIRDFARMLLQRNARFKYLLLMGDGSFDYKRIYPLGNLQASDFVPAYETDESFDPIDAFPSDDFFGLLSDTEGLYLSGDLDIAVGRFPCKTLTEANAIVDKIVRYESAPSFGDWRNRAIFMGDDEDANYHTNDADKIADYVFAAQKNFNIEKLYVDAYRQEVSAGGTRVPQMNDAIYQNQFKGALTMCYLGHGGPRGLAQERILMREDLESWENIDRLPIFITATCSFSGYDNPREVSAGETAILNPKGGAVALYSTVRAVYANSNAELTTAVFDTIFARKNFAAQTLGDIFTEAKNRSQTGVNGQKFTLLGDPSMRLAMPRYQITTTKINNKPAGNTATDTVRALQRVTIEGAVVGDNGQVMTNFNGTIYPTVFDKAATLRTLGQDPTSYPRDFVVQRNIIFKGAATVEKGVWKFSFVVPRDIDYSFGTGKISYYATDNATDAAGNFENFVIGGTDPTIPKDDKAPLVNVYMNDNKFAFGGMTDPNPTLYVELSDDLGINVAGTSIGHDLTGVLNDSKTALTLNNFYQAVKDDPAKGVVRYPLSKLSVGRHRITVKAWDVANNPGEGVTEFVVATDAKAALAHVLNYPNPFTTRTNFQFEHNLAGQSLKVRVNIYSVSGRLVKTIDRDLDTEGYRVNDIDWDGKDEYGGDLARGVYLYKVKVTGKDATGKSLTAESSFEKLVILK